MSFIGLCKGLTRSIFQMFGIFELFRELFMASVRYLSGMGHIFLNGLALIYLGPAPHLSLSLIAFFSVLHLTILPTTSSFPIVQSVFLPWFSFFLGCGVYCWLNLFAQFLATWWGLFLLPSTYMALLGLALLPESFFTVLQKCLYKRDRFLFFWLRTSLFISWFSCVFLGPMDVFF